MQKLAQSRLMVRTLTEMPKNRMFNCCSLIFNIGRRVFKYTKRMIARVWVVLSSWFTACCKRDTNDPQTERVCKKCLELEEKIKTSEQILNQTLQEHTELLGEYDNIKFEEQQLRQKNTELEKSSDEITAHMASTLETKGYLENANDEFSNTKLGKTFEKLNSEKWIEVAECLDKTVPGLNELEKIKTLTTLMKNSYEECLRLADDQIRSFLFLSKEDEVPSFEKDDLLFKTRRLCGQKSSTRESVKKNVLSVVLNSEKTKEFIHGENENEAKEKIEDFFRRYIECCWLMTISHPKMILVFNVIGQRYTGVIKERFKQFSTQEEVEDMDLDKDSVYEVVWPCVVLEDGSGVYAKGDVITVDIGKEAQELKKQK